VPQEREESAPAALISRAIPPVMKKKFKEDLEDKPYCLMCDGRVDEACKKHLYNKVDKYEI